MGRRSINTTKSGKYMNPTDQARKEARKKELKKNKKQRQLVRAAVLKGKDPAQIIEEMEKIDQMEYNVMQPPPLNEKVLKDKRKKLKETLDRVLKMYVSTTYVTVINFLQKLLAKDDQEKWAELKEQLMQYERKRIDLVSYFEAVRHAQQVQVDEIPLPSAGSLTSQIPLPDMPQPPTHMYPPHPHYMPQHHPLMNIPIPPSILKKTSAYATSPSIPTLAPNKEPPGVPPFPPPDLSSDDEDISEETKETLPKSRTIRFADDKEDNKQELDNKDKDTDKEKEKERDMSKVKPTTLQQKMLAMAGQDIDQFMREMEVVHKKRETERAQDLNARLSLLEAENESNSKSNNKSGNNKTEEEDLEPPGASDHSSNHNQHTSHSHSQHTQPHTMPPMGLPPPPLMYRPPPPPLHLRMPPPPPPRIGLRLPPGPPPGMPRMLRPGPPSMPRMPPPQMQMPNLSNMTNIGNPQMPTQSGTGSQPKTPNVLSAAPQLINRKDKDGKSTTTIEAKPQIRNLAADVTRFLPTSLRVKRDDKKKPSTLSRLSERIPETQPVRTTQPKTKDDAYMQPWWDSTTVEVPCVAATHPMFCSITSQEAFKEPSLLQINKLQSHPQRLKPILKQPSNIQQQSAVTVQNNPVSSSQTLVPIPTSPLTANSNPTPPINKNVSEGKNENQVSESADAEVQEQHPRWRRKAPGFRVNKRLKRLRLNQRLKKTLQPKNAIMVLNEMKPGVQFTFPETQGPMPNSLYLVHAELDGKTYVGQGLSKPLARQNAAENALKALLLEKMTAASMKARIDAESDGQANQSSESSNTAKEDNNEEAVTPMDVSVDESDEIPWSSLASFALYKLFLEWHNQGTSVPVPRPGLPSPAKGMKREISHVQKTPVQKELPPNATNIHPVMLLNQMRPGLTYVELNRVGNPPNTMFTLAVDIDDVEYTGTAKNKKDAKKIAAKSALLALYGLNYPDEVKPVSQDQAVA
ncbi:WW domain-binding protein 11 [Eufriesea mexicana]|nr:WW domain-binding protein 11 [Eufriesea mexicana]